MLVLTSSPLVLRLGLIVAGALVLKKITISYKIYCIQVGDSVCLKGKND
jgi:hypothetical protein